MFKPAKPAKFSAMRDYLPRIGARGSPLSLAQTSLVRAQLAALMKRGAEELPLQPFTTSGDVRQEGRLVEVGGKGLFTKELDEALLDGRIDLAVHSLKDLPTRLPEGIVLAAVPAREDPRDAFIAHDARSLADLAPGSLVGTASLRRQAQTLHARPDLQVAIMRGNVDTRLRKLAEGQASATYLALSGLKRLGLEQCFSSLVNPREAPPAPSQGALAITARAGDERALALAAKLEDFGARLEIEMERAFLDALEGSCRTPIGALARYENGALDFLGEALTPDGAQRWRRETMLAGPTLATARAKGAELGAAIKAEAGDLLKEALA